MSLMFQLGFGGYEISLSFDWDPGLCNGWRSGWVRHLNVFILLRRPRSFIHGADAYSRVLADCARILKPCG